MSLKVQNYIPSEGIAVFSPFGTQRVTSAFNSGFIYRSRIGNEILIDNNRSVDSCWETGNIYFIQNNSIIKMKYNGEHIYSIELGNPICIAVSQAKLPMEVDPLNFRDDNGCWVIDSATNHLLKIDNQMNIVSTITNLYEPKLVISSDMDGGCYLFDDTLRLIIKINDGFDATSIISYDDIFNNETSLISANDIKRAIVDHQGNLWVLIDKHLFKILLVNGGLSLSKIVNPNSVVDEPLTYPAAKIVTSNKTYARIDLSNGEITNSVKTNIAFTDIATLDNEFYGIFLNKLYKIFDDGSTSVLSANMAIGNAAAFSNTIFEEIPALYVVSGHNLVRYEIGTWIQTSSITLNNSSSGDLVFNNGSLYMSTSNGKLVKITTNPYSEVIVATIPSDTFGLVSVNGDVYGMHGSTSLLTNLVSGTYSDLAIMNATYGICNGLTEDDSLVFSPVSDFDIDRSPLSSAIYVTGGCRNNAWIIKYDLNGAINSYSKEIQIEHPTRIKVTQYNGSNGIYVLTENNSTYFPGECQSSSSSSFQDYVTVSGTFSPDATGIYNNNGLILDGEPVFERSGGVYIIRFYSGDQWYIESSTYPLPPEYWARGVGDPINGSYLPFNGATGTAIVTGNA